MCLGLEKRYVGHLLTQSCFESLYLGINTCNVVTAHILTFNVARCQSLSCQGTVKQISHKEYKEWHKRSFWQEQVTTPGLGQHFMCSLCHSTCLTDCLTETAKCEVLNSVFNVLAWLQTITCVHTVFLYAYLGNLMKLHFTM